MSAVIAVSAAAIVFSAAAPPDRGALRSAAAAVPSPSGGGLPSASAPPRIRGNAHLGYAIMISNGYRHQDACRQLGLNPRTVERWRHNLMRVGRDFFGFDVTYEKCAATAVEEHRKSEERIKKLREANTANTAASANRPAH